MHLECGAPRRFGSEVGWSAASTGCVVVERLESGAERRTPKCGPAPLPRRCLDVAASWWDARGDVHPVGSSRVLGSGRWAPAVGGAGVHGAGAGLVGGPTHCRSRRPRGGAGSGLTTRLTTSWRGDCGRPAWNRPGPRIVPRLLRRACFDLHGLPPTPEQMEVFLQDRRPDAWERLIDRLLESPRYGRALGTALAGRGPVRGERRVPARRLPARCLALS